MTNLPITDEARELIRNQGREDLNAIRETANARTIALLQSQQAQALQTAHVSRLNNWLLSLARRRANHVNDPRGLDS